MAKSTLLIGLISLAFTSIANAQTGLYMLEAPVNGAVRPVAGNTAVMYVGTLGANDSFSFATEDENGMSFVDVTLVPEFGMTLISSTDFGGPLALGATSFAMAKTKGGGETPATPSGNAGEESANEKEEDNPYVVIIYVDQPGEGGDRQPYEGNGITSPVDVGHTFIEVINGETDESVTVGLYPDGDNGDGVSPLDPEDPGIILDDSDHPWDVKAKFEITEEQYKELVEQIEKDRKDPPDYDLNDCNCTDYVLDLLNDIGINIESEEGTWPLGGGHNPGDLGEDLVEHYDGERNAEPAEGDGSSK